MLHGRISFLAAVTVSALMIGGIVQAQTVSPATATQAIPNPLTLDQAIRIALAAQPSQAIASTQLSQAGAVKQQALAQYYPVVAPSYQYQDTRQSFYGISTTGFNGINVPISGATTQRGGTGALSVRENLFDSGQREVANALARRQIDAASLTTRDTRQQVIAAVTQAFFELLRAQDLKTVADAQVRRAQATLDQTQGRIDAGVAPRKDVYQSRADLANAQVSQLQALDSVESNAASLKNAMGIETSGSIHPQPLAAPGSLPTPPAVETARAVADDLAAALHSRPDLRGQSVAVESSQLAVKQARIAAGLSLTGTAALNYEPINDIGSRGNQYQIVGVASYPLFDGGAAKAGVRSAVAQRDSAIDRLAQVRQQVRLEVEQASIQRAESLQRIQLARAAVDAAQVNYDAAVASRAEGLGTPLDVTTAEVTLTQAQNQYVTAIYDYYESDARLQRAIGENDLAYPRR